MKELFDFIEPDFEFEQGRYTPYLKGGVEEGICRAFTTQWIADTFVGQAGPEIAFKRIIQGGITTLQQIARNQSGYQTNFGARNFNAPNGVEAARRSMELCVQYASRSRVSILKDAIEVYDTNFWLQVLQEISRKQRSKIGFVMSLYPNSGGAHCIGMIAERSMAEPDRYFVLDPNIGLMKTDPYSRDDLENLLLGLWHFYKLDLAILYPLK
jgi:hypothetical protein